MSVGDMCFTIAERCSLAIENQTLIATGSQYGSGSLICVNIACEKESSGGDVLNRRCDCKRYFAPIAYSLSPRRISSRSPAGAAA